MNYKRVDHNECIKGILRNYILGALSIAIPSCSAITDGKPWRDGGSRDLRPALIMTFHTVRRLASNLASFD